MDRGRRDQRLIARRSRAATRRATVLRVDEDSLWAWHESYSHPLTVALFEPLRERLRYWPTAGPLPAQLAQLDTPGRCLATASKIHALVGHDVAMGWVASAAYDTPVVHAWNVTEDGQVVDTAERRRSATGFLGAVVTPEEVEKYGPLLLAAGQL